MAFTTMALTPETLVVIWLAVLAGGLLLSALCSGFETGVYALSPVRLRIRSDEPGDGSARIVRSLLADRERLLISLLIGNTIANNLMTTAMLLLLLGAGVHSHHAESYTTLIVTPLAFVVGEMVPKNHFREQADRLVYRWAGVVRSMVFLLRSIGLVALIRGIVAGPARLLRSATTSEALDSRDAVRTMLLETSATGVLTPHQAEMADNVLDIGSVTLRMVMVPLTRVVMISENYTLEEFRRLAAHFSYSQVPVYARGERNRIIGVVNVVDGLLAPADGWIPAVVMQPAVSLDVTLPVMRALATLRERRAVMAVAVDGSGRGLGIVTIKDLVEEIVGELAAW